MEQSIYELEENCFDILKEDIYEQEQSLDVSSSEDQNDIDPNRCPPSHSRGGFVYELLTSHPKVCIYAKTDSKSGRFVAFEVFRVKFKKERVLDGRVLPAGFQFPHNEAGGKWLWTYRDLDKAILKFISIIGE